MYSGDVAEEHSLDHFDVDTKGMNTTIRETMIRETGHDTAREVQTTDLR